MVSSGRMLLPTSRLAGLEASEALAELEAQQEEILSRGFDFSNFGSGGSGFSSFFENLFGGGARRRSGSAGFDGFGGGTEYGSQNMRQSTGEMQMNVNIDMYTALLGGEGIIRLSNGSKIKLKIKLERRTEPRFGFVEKDATVVTEHLAI